jgi:hypothetical protein
MRVRGVRDIKICSKYKYILVSRFELGLNLNEPELNLLN